MASCHTQPLMRRLVAPSSLPQRAFSFKSFKSRISRYVTRPWAVSGVKENPPESSNADELHLVPISGSSWKLALWRYCPPPDAPLRKHPLLLLPATGTKAISFNLDERVSLARCMSDKGFDTWILEVRGCRPWKRKGNHNLVGYTRKQGTPIEKTECSALQKNHFDSLPGKACKTSPCFQQQQSSSFASLKKHTEMVHDYECWNFDTYVQEDIPRAMEYIRNHSHSEDGKLLSVGHSLGGMLLYGCIAIQAGEHSDFAGIVTIGSALDHGVSNSSLKLLLPFANAVKALGGDFVPLDTLMGIIYPLLVYPPYAFTWLGSHVSFGNMIEHDIFEKLLLTSFCAVPVRLLLQLLTVFEPGGLRNSDGTIKYKELLKHCDVPVLAIAGDKDLICHPQAALDTVKALPQKMAVFKQFGDDNHHYGHYDLICGYLARKEVFPVIIDHLIKCDNQPSTKHSSEPQDKSASQD